MDSIKEGLHFNSKQKEILSEYCGNGGRKLDQICKRLVHKKNVPLYLEDDLYSLAQWTFLESLQTFDDSKDNKFSTYLINSIWKAFYDWTRDNMRGKRCNLLRDKNGKIVLQDKNGNIVKENGDVTIIPNISLDAKIEDDVDWCEKVASDFNIEKETDLSSDNDEWHEEVKEFLNGLSPLQQKVILMISNDFDKEEICELLHITTDHYNNSLKRIMSSERIRPLRILIEGRQ